MEPVRKERESRAHGATLRDGVRFTCRNRVTDGEVGQRQRHEGGEAAEGVGGEAAARTGRGKGSERGVCRGGDPHDPAQRERSGEGGAALVQLACTECGQALGHASRTRRRVLVRARDRHARSAHRTEVLRRGRGEHAGPGMPSQLSHQPPPPRDVRERRSAQR